MNRRQFCQKSLRLVGAAATPGWFEILHPRKQAGDPVIGHGDFRYRIRLDWATQNDAAAFPVNDCHEMVTDRRGRIFLSTNDTHNNILIFNKDGKILDGWGTEFPGAHGLTLHDEGGEEFLYLTDYERHEVVKTTLAGRVVQQFSYPSDSGKYASADEFKPTETAILPNGELVVADGYGLDYIIHYDRSGKVKNIFGGKPELNNAHGIALDMRDPAEPVLLVTSRADNALKRYSLDGRLLQSIALPGAYICRPVVHGENVFFAVLISKLPWDSQSGFVMILDKNNRVVSCPGGSTPRYDADGAPEAFHQTVKVFRHPHDVLADNDQNLYVSQWNSGKVYPARLERV